MNTVVQDAVTARTEGRYEDALRFLTELFGQVDKGLPGADRHHFITMFEWSMLAEEYYPARDALVTVRDEQMRRLLGGDDIFGARDGSRPESRFGLIVDMNETLKDTRATYELFVQLLSLQPALADREAYVALPAIVEAGDFSLAERYIADPLGRLDELNQLASRFPLFPPLHTAPRLAAELTNFIQDVVLRAAVLEGLGRDSEAKSLLSTALTGIASEDIRALASREIDEPGTIMREISSHQMSLDVANRL